MNFLFYFYPNLCFDFLFYKNTHELFHVEKLKKNNSKYKSVKKNPKK
jgi:hypothetical protein